jgi:nuclear transport factor 2 (NTF2) superfamily protein
MALRREVLLALMRLWDKDSRTVKVTGIAELLRDKAFFDELVRQRAGHLGYSFDVTDRMREALEPKRVRISALTRKYTHGQEYSTVLERLTALRHEQLAHRQTREPTDPAGLQHTDEEVEEFYLDTLEIVELMLSVFLGRAFDIAGEAGDVYRHHAEYFWAGVCGERTEGHPLFKPRHE